MVRKLGVIGYGKMGSALVDGAIKAGVLSAEMTGVYELSPERQVAAQKAGLSLLSDLGELQNYDSILLAIKPKEIPKILDRLKYCTVEGKVHYISIAAGIKINTYLSRLGQNARVTRVMPNIAASVNQAASVYIHSKAVTKADRKFVSSFLKGVGMAISIEEEALIDTITGISGSGPAYFFLLMDIMVKAGVDAGIPEDLARELVSQTCLGAGSMARESSDRLVDLIRAVASPGGTTEEALKVMESRGISKIIYDAIVAAIEKSKKMNYS
uniref:Pyrroline-5-carboxylate reductase n=1 Tax=Candidatus Methanomethylicus mesodigestus TaxID=1867258 RepID=A0A7C3ESV2_9CREN